MGTWPVIKPSAAGAYDEPIRFGCSPGPGRHGAMRISGGQGAGDGEGERSQAVTRKEDARARPLRPGLPGRGVRKAAPRQPRKGAKATSAKIFWLGAAGGPGHYPPTWWARLGLLHSTTASVSVPPAPLAKSEWERELQFSTAHRSRGALDRRGRGPRTARGKTGTKQPQSGARVPSPALPRATRWKRARMERARQGRRGGGARLGSGTTLVARHPTWLVASLGSAAGPARRANK